MIPSNCHDSTHPSQVDNAKNYSEDYLICNTIEKNVDLFLSQSSFNSIDNHPIQRKTMIDEPLSRNN